MANRSSSQQEPSRPGRDWLWGLLLLLAVIVTYSPVWHAGYVWDDDRHLTANPCIIGPLGLKDIWTTHAAGIDPLVLTTFWMGNALWGLVPLPYHLVNVALHGLSAVLLWRLLLTLRISGAWLGAALWALHPVQVESVAWISELKNIQSGLFYLLTLHFFVKTLRTRPPGGPRASGWNYALMLVCAALAMASKTSTVVLPLVLCLCAWWLEGRWNWRNLLKLAPVFFMSIAGCFLTIGMQGLHPAAVSDPNAPHTAPGHLVAAGGAVWFYLGKLAWPHPLITIYPLSELNAGRPLSYLPLLAVAIVLFLLWRNRNSSARPYFFAFAYFLVAMLPELELADSYLADHYQYLSSMGPLALLGAGMVRLGDYVLPKKPWLQSTLAAGVLLLLGLLSWQRAWAYESDETLWTDTLDRNPNCWVGYGNLGNCLMAKGQVTEAMAQYQQLLRINPSDANAFLHLGVAKEAQGDWNGALSDLRRFGELAPHNPMADYAHLWIWLIRAQQIQKREADQELAVCLSSRWNASPQDWVSKNAAFLLGRISEDDYLAAASSPYPVVNQGQHCEAWYYVGMVRLLANDKSSASDCFRKCLATGKKDFFEYWLAQAQLRTLTSSK